MGKVEQSLSVLTECGISKKMEVAVERVLTASFSSYQSKAVLIKEIGQEGAIHSFHSGLPIKVERRFGFRKTDL
jgi:hypothetical protein